MDDAPGALGGSAGADRPSSLWQCPAAKAATAKAGGD